jgi:hypothetical protein
MVPSTLGPLGDLHNTDITIRFITQNQQIAAPNFGGRTLGCLLAEKA